MIKEKFHEVEAAIAASMERRTRVPKDAPVKLIAVTKNHDVAAMREAIDAGATDVGENRIQEAKEKYAVLDREVTWHLIGHLQTNKVKYIVPYITMIEAVDSLRLLREIEKQASKVGRTIKVLLELHIAEEATKYGLTTTDCLQLLDDGEWRQMQHVQICGLMMMASNVDDEEQIAAEFETAARFFDEVKARYFADDDAFCERSWGMSDDYPIAVRHRSTMVRIGTAIFGPRVY